MAITRVKKGFYLIGLSADVKPTTGIPVYTQFMESDTGDVYILTYTAANDGTIEWVKITAR